MPPVTPQRFGMIGPLNTAVELGELNRVEDHHLWNLSQRGWPSHLSDLHRGWSPRLTLSHITCSKMSRDGSAPRYLLTDDSGGEQLALGKIFPDLLYAKTEVTHRLCTGYLMRTVYNHCSINWKVQNLLCQAMFCNTKIKCEEPCLKAMSLASSDKTRTYINKHCLYTSAEWAMYPFNHGPVLMQVTTTNSCKAWHWKLKAVGSLHKGDNWWHGIQGIILHIIQQALEVDLRVRKEASAFWTNHLAIHTNHYPDNGIFPVSIRKLLVPESDGVEDCILKGEQISGLNSILDCNCLFAWRNLLPCHHIFHFDTESPVKILTSVHWQPYSLSFHESRFEVYETSGHIPMNLDAFRDS